MNSKNRKASDPHRLLLNLTGKIDLRRKNKYIASSNFGENIKMERYKKFI